MSDPETSDMDVGHVAKRADPGWHNWKENNYAMWPWTQEIHRMKEHCNCDRHGQPTSKVTPEQAAGLLGDSNLITPGNCIGFHEKLALMRGDEDEE